MHDDEQPVDRPADAVVGRWGSNASCVVIRPNMVLTTCHQGGGVGTLVEIDGVTYRVEDVLSHSVADVRVARITTLEDGPVALQQWACEYTGTADTHLTTIIGGYGKGRGETIYTPGGTPYAYAWAGSGNSTLRWGANYVDVPVYQIQVGLLRSKGLRADFDDVGEGGHVPYEAAPALHDSGCGWFIEEGDRWHVIGLSAVVEHQYATWFRNATTGLPDPDYVYAVQVRYYADWISTAATGWCLPGDANGDGLVNGTDYTIWCDHHRDENILPYSQGGWVVGNFNEDTVINGADYTVWVENYGATYKAADGAGIPEPAMVSLLVLAVPPLLRRRRGRP